MARQVLNFCNDVSVRARAHTYSKGKEITFTFSKTQKITELGSSYEFVSHLKNFRFSAYKEEIQVRSNKVIRGLTPNFSDTLNSLEVLNFCFSPTLKLYFPATQWKDHLPSRLIPGLLMVRGWKLFLG